MHTYQDQLSELEKDELKNENSSPSPKSLELMFSRIGIAVNLIALFCSIGLTCLLFRVMFPKADLADYIILWLFFGSIVIIYLHACLLVFFEYLSNRYYKIYKEAYDKYLATKGILSDKRRFIEKEITKEKEKDFVNRLNLLVDQVEKRQISLDKALGEERTLKSENDRWSKSGYRSHSGEYFERRFDRIRYALNNRDQSITQTSTSKTVDLDSNIKANPPAIPIGKDSFQISNADDSIVVDKKISELFATKKQALTRSNIHIDRSPIKIDYLKLQEKMQTVGLLGELFVLGWEQNRLTEFSKKLDIDKVTHVSKTNDLAGFDILSFNEDGSRRFIEVKTTTETHESPFYLSETENLEMQRLENYFIYRVYNFNLETNTGELFIIKCDTDLGVYFNMRPVSYRVSPK